jgi:hypothetical protein
MNCQTFVLFLQPTNLPTNENEPDPGNSGEEKMDSDIERTS